MKIPIDHYKNVIRVLEIPSFSDALKCLDRKGQSSIASYLITNMLENNTQLTSDVNIDQVYICSKKAEFDQY